VASRAGLCVGVRIKVLVQVGYYHDCERRKVEIENSEKFLKAACYYPINCASAPREFFVGLCLADS